MSRIIIVTELFYPDETTTAHILTKIATKLCEKFKVIVITGPTGYDGNQSTQMICQKHNNIEIIRLKSKLLNKNNLIQRGIKFITISHKLKNELKKIYSLGDRVIIVTNPAPLVLEISKLKKNLNFNLTVLVHDVFPENTIPAYIFKSERNIIYRYLLNKFNRAYASADNLIVLGKDMLNVMEKKVSPYRKPKISIIENWFDRNNNNYSYFQSEKITIQYAGNIGRVQGLDSFLSIYTESDNENISLELYGDGAILPIINKRIQNNTYKRVCYRGKFNKDNQFEVMSNCDIALISLADGMYGLGVPSKTYNILHAGKPILFVGHPESEIGRLIIDNNIGYVFSPNDHNGLKEFLLSINIGMRPKLRKMGLKSKQLADEKYSEAIILNKYLKLFSE